MTIDNKIQKIAEWITHESDDTEGEVACLLHNVYNSKMSGLSHNIDEAFEDVFKHLGIDDCPHSKWQQKGEPEFREDGTPYLKWDADIQCTCD